MDNPIWGILTIVFCGIFYVASYAFQRKDKYLFAVLLLMLSGLILRVFTSCDFFLHPWDEVFHAVVAKHMMLHPLTPTLYETPVLPYDYDNWTGNHIWVHKQPLPLWTMALSMYLFGVNEIALRLPSIVLTTVGIGLTYYIGRYFFDRRTGYLAAFFYSINGLIIEMTAGRVPTDHVDVFFLFFIELAIFFSIVFSKKKQLVYNILAGLSIGAAILCKWLPALIVLPIWLLIVIDSKQFSTRRIVIQFGILIVTLVAVFLPWQLYIYHVFPLEATWEGNYNIRHLSEAIESHKEPFYYFWERIRINYGELIYLPLIWLIWSSYKEIKNLKLLTLCIWIFIPLIFFSVTATKLQGYILFTSPALFIITSALVFTIVEFRSKILPESAHKFLAIWVTNLILFLFAALPIRYAIERIKPFKTKRQPQWVIGLKAWDHKKDIKSVLFNYDKPIDAMFYTDLTVYATIPKIDKIHSLQQEGYTVYINDNGRVSEDLFKAENVVRIKLSAPSF